MQTKSRFSFRCDDTMYNSFAIFFSMIALEILVDDDREQVFTMVEFIAYVSPEIICLILPLFFHLCLLLGKELEMGH